MKMLQVVFGLVCLALNIPAIFWEAKVAGIIWGWYAVPYGYAPIPSPVWIGVGFLLSMFFMPSFASVKSQMENRFEKEKGKDFAFLHSCLSALFMNYAAPALVLLMAWIVK